MDGSSPLARGLRRRVSGAGVCGGIIPARAGFTHHRARHHLPLRDHPRSRGVYASRGSITQHSPWIIPARAGFTPRQGLGSGRGDDHPRSRGVYSSGTPPRATARDHPRSRGVYDVLLDMALEGITIIPARAGFTTPPWG